MRDGQASGARHFGQGRIECKVSGLLGTSVHSRHGRDAASRPNHTARRLSHALSVGVVFCVSELFPTRSASAKTPVSSSSHAGLPHIAREDVRGHRPAHRPQRPAGMPQDRRPAPRAYLRGTPSDGLLRRQGCQAVSRGRAMASQSPTGFVGGVVTSSCLPVAAAAPAPEGGGRPGCGGRGRRPRVYSAYTRPVGGSACRYFLAGNSFATVLLEPGPSPLCQ